VTDRIAFCPLGDQVDMGGVPGFQLAAGDSSSQVLGRVKVATLGRPFGQRARASRTESRISGATMKPATQYPRRA
jgi:hypothetical protein